MRFKVLLKSSRSRGRPALQPLLPGGCWVTIPAPRTGEEGPPGRVQTGLRASEEHANGEGRRNRCSRWNKTKKKKFPLKIPCSWVYVFFSFCRGRIPVCLKYTWPAICQGKYLKKAASRLLGRCNLAFKEN